MATREAALRAGMGHATATGESTYAGGLMSWIKTVDHKRIGILYGSTALAFFLLGGVEALIIRAQLAKPENAMISADMYRQLFTMHGTTMIFLALMPLSVAFFNYIVPLQIGARDVAFPRLNAFSYWMFLFGGLFLYSSFLFGGAPDAGWFGYANLTSTQFSPGVRLDFWVLGLQLLGISSLVGALNFVVTIINLRAPGMKLMRMPLFTWMTLVTTVLIILAFPVLTIGLVYLMFDRFFGANIFNPGANGDPRLWQHYFWIFGHPEVYILILPAFGVISEVVPTFSRKPLFGYPVVVYSGVMIAFLGFGVWAHHMFATGLGPVANSVFASTTMLIAIPTGVKIFNWIGTMWGGSIRLKTPMLFAVGMIAMFIIGGLSGVMHASPPADLQQTDSYFVVAHLHYVLFGGTILGLFAGIYYWFPKITGRMMSESIGKWHFWTTLIAFNITFFPMHFLGLLGMPRRTWTYEKGLGFGEMNLWATIGAFLLGASVLIFVYNFFRSLKKGEKAEANPWEGATLEWSTSSPPPHYNFKVIPEVHSRDPLWAEAFSDELEAELAAEAGDVTVASKTIGEVGIPHGGEPSMETGEPHMPSPSGYPILLASGALICAIGALLGQESTGFPSLGIVFLGLAVMFYSAYGWAYQPIDH